MDADAYLQEILRSITGEDVQDTAYGLDSIYRHPTGNKQVIEHLETMLNDRRICGIGAPRYYMEIRRLAAYALNAEREKCGITTPICFQAMSPLSGSKVWRLAIETGVVRTEKGNNRTILEILEELIQKDLVPVIDRTLTPELKNDDDQDNQEVNNKE
jgi:hypothetical protein